MRDNLVLLLKKRAPEIGAVMLACFGCVVLVMSLSASAGQQELVVEDDAESGSAAELAVSPTITSAALHDSDVTLPSHQENIYVDVSGAVNKPGVYSLPPNSRLSDAIKMAGGLSRNADVDYFSRNYNTARLLTDQEKIYVPRSDEIADGTFVEGVYFIDHSLQRSGISPGVENKDAGTVAGSTSSSGININTASADELETLSGIGPVTAQKIIDNRPYTDVNDLLTQKIVKESVYNNIKDEMTVGGAL